MKSEINFFSEDIDFQVINGKTIRDWIKKCLAKESKSCGVLNIIFCSDHYLLDINQEYLKHNTFTDIITFNYVEGSVISGDIFISVDRIKDNSEQLNIGFQEEVKRVIIHGILHLIGYNDKSASEADEIRAKEDFYLALYPK